MIDRKQQAQYYRELGRREGEIDAIYADGFSTVRERAEHAAMQMRIVAYRRDFIAGYMEEAEASSLQGR